MREWGKWPRVLVVGGPVSEEQANEILIRTNSWYLSTNDNDFEKVVAELAGISIGRYGMFDLDSVRRFEQRYHVLELHYLHNWRICSAWIRGPFGWCDWDGVIGCSTWNIGKWPTVEEVTHDWELIAEAFPFLDLTAQLVGDEGVDGFPAAQWRLDGGGVVFDDAPTELIRPVDDIDIRASLEAIRHDPFRERGVTRERLEQALRQVQATFVTETNPDE